MHMEAHHGIHVEIRGPLVGLDLPSTMGALRSKLWSSTDKHLYLLGHIWLALLPASLSPG